MKIDPHVSDTDLVMLLDGELEGLRQGVVTTHLKACVNCRERSATLQAASNRFAAWHGELDQRPVLQTLAAVPARPRRGAPRWILAGLACAASFVVAVLVWTNLPSSLAAATPDPEQTPGVTASTNTAQVCATPAGTSNLIPPELAAKVFERYGIRDPRPRSYEVDYLITPALGGAVDIRNLWPQPYSNGVWNSHVKDALEDLLRQKVCSGQMDLAEAQRELAHGWVAAYKRHFGSQQPLAEHRRFVKDEPWQ